MSRYPVRLDPDGEGEIQDAMAWYAERIPGLERSFLESVDQVMASLSEMPEMYPRVRGDVRRALVRGFPYAVFYLFEKDEVIVLSCRHDRRDPRGWPER